MSNSFFSNRFLRTLVLVIFFLGAFGLGLSVTQATDTTSYTPLAPIPQLSSNTACATNPTSANCPINISTYIPSVVKLIIGIAGALAVIMIVIGGVQYLSTDAMQGKTDGKNKIINAISGLLLAIGAFVILNTINPETLKLNLNLTLPKTSTTPTCTGTMVNGVCQPSKTPTDVTKVASNGRVAWPDAGVALGTEISDSNARTLLAGVTASTGVTFTTNADCQYIDQTGCTSLDGLSQGAQRGLTALAKRMKDAGGTSIQINGGTEYWLHCVPDTLPTPCDDLSTNSTAHQPGKGAVDLQALPALNKIITTKGESLYAVPYVPTTSNPKPPRNGCQSPALGAWSLDGAIYTREKPGEWHVCYGP